MWYQSQRALLKYGHIWGLKQKLWTRKRNSTWEPRIRVRGDLKQNTENTQLGSGADE